jgi:hypothetical protein
MSPNPASGVSHPVMVSTRKWRFAPSFAAVMTFAEGTGLVFVRRARSSSSFSTRV